MRDVTFLFACVCKPFKCYAKRKLVNQQVQRLTTDNLPMSSNKTLHLY